MREGKDFYHKQQRFVFVGLILDISWPVQAIKYPEPGQAWSSQSPRGQWKTGKMEKTGCEICGAQTTLAAKG